MNQTLQSKKYWSTPVWIIPPAVELKSQLAEIKDKILKCKSMADPSFNKSVKNGWRVDDIHKIDGLTIIGNYMIWMCQKCFEEVGFTYNQKTHSLTLSTWLNVHDKNGFNSVHDHAGSLISGVLFINCPEGSGNLIFRDPRRSSSTCKLLSMANKELVVTPRPGNAVLFPGYLEHFVEPSSTAEDDPRISVAFNVNQIINH